MRPDTSDGQNPENMPFDKWLAQQVDAAAAARAVSREPPLGRGAEGGDPAKKVGENVEQVHDDLQSILSMPFGSDWDASGTPEELGMTGTYGGGLWGVDEVASAEGATLNPGAEQLGLGGTSLVTRSASAGKVEKEVLGVTGTFPEIDALCKAHNAREQRLDAFLHGRLGRMADGMLVRQVAEPAQVGTVWKMKMKQDEVPELRDDILELHGGNAELTGQGQMDLNASEHAEMAEWKREFAAHYARINAYLLQGQGARPNTEEVLRFQGRGRLRKLVEAIRTDVKLRDYLRSVLPALIAFSNAPDGEILDTIGAKNMFFLRGPQGESTLRLVDALHPTADLLAQARRMLRMSIEKPRGESPDLQVLMDVMNYARTVNFLADILDLPPEDRFQLLPEDLRSATIDYDRILEVIRFEFRFG